MNHHDPFFEPSAVVGECENVPVTPMTTSPSIIKVPVVLAEVNVRTNLVANIHFPCPVLEIKDIKKQLKLVQCRLLLPSNQLFIKGFIRKNIKYATPTAVMNRSVQSNLLSLTIDIPFHCVTEITRFLNPPTPLRFNSRKEFDFFVAKDLPDGFPEKDQLLSSDLSQFHQESTQHYNELPFCELISSHIIEWDEAVNRQQLSGGSFEGRTFEEGTFTKMVEKMFVDFTVKVLQKQQVSLAPPPTPTPTPTPLPGDLWQS